jgi:DNA-binding transcriptional LysR family regulator
MHSQLRDIEYFAVIAEHGQLQRAAVALGLSQAALSKSLRRLETSMNAKLLKRTPKGVELTVVGSALLSRVGKLRLSVDDVAREIADLSGGRAGHLRIGTAAGAALHLVPLACEALLRESPRVTFKITVQDTNVLLASLRNGELDLAVANLQGAHHEDLVEAHTQDDVWIICASAKHRLAKRKSLVLAVLAHERWALPSADSVVVRILSDEFGKKGLPPPHIAVETIYLPTRQHLVGATDLLAVALRPTVRHGASRYGIVELRVKDFLVTRRGGVIYRKDAYLSPAARRFIEILEKTAKTLV